MNIQQIINKAATRLREPSIPSVSSTTNEQAIKYLESANKVAKSIAEIYNWSNLTLDYSFDTVVDQQSYNLPSDFSRFVSTYLYNIDQNTKISSSTSDNALATEASGVISWTTTSFRLTRDSITFTVPADQMNEIKFSYITKELVKNTESDIIYKEQFEVNADEFLLDDELLVIGIVIDIKEEYGFDASLDITEFQSRLDMLTRNNKGGFILTDSDNYRASPFTYPTDYSIVEN